MPAPLTIAIIGGGFTGAATAFHIARRAIPNLRIAIYEPRQTLGAGLAYSTQNPVHRLNARGQRMSLIPDQQTHFCDWVSTSQRCANDPEAILPDGRIFARRHVYAAYMADQLAPYIANNTITHIQSPATSITKTGGTWRIESETHPPLTAGIAILATGHAPPKPPGCLAEALSTHPAFIPNPMTPGALAKIPSPANILIIGTGLTMADIAASLHAQNHTGPILAISRRGQSPRHHATPDAAPFGDFAKNPARTTIQLLHKVRATVAAAQGAKIPWQAVVDMLRHQAPAIWQNLPEPEQKRILRHLRPYWDSHRHRLPPQIATTLAEQIATRRLQIRAATIGQARIIQNRFEISLRPRGAQHFTPQLFDAVIVTTGPSPAAISAGPLQSLHTAGHIGPDSLSQGLSCDNHGRAIGHDGTPAQNLFIAGPLAKGHFGELISVPEIAIQADRLAAQIAAALV